MHKACTILALLLTLTACSATVPAAGSKLEPTRRAVARAYAEGASEIAPEDYRLAKARLSLAEESLRRGEEERADLALSQAGYFARRARQKTEAAWSSIRKELSQGVELSPSAGGGRGEEGGGQGEIRTDAAEELDVPVAPEVDQTTPLPIANAPSVRNEKAPREYVVKDGETLWTIAAQRKVYRDALLWPLLYKANRDQIKDPRQIFPQQVLTVPRGVPEPEMEEAREKARRSEIFPVEVLLRQVADGEK